MSRNYAAFGEFTAFGAQARDAAARRFAHLTNASVQLSRAAQKPEEPLSATGVSQMIEDAVAAEREMLAALTRANQAAALCGERELRVAQLLPLKD